MICEAVAPSALIPAPPASPDVSPALAEFSARIGRTVATMHEQSGGILRIAVVDGKAWELLNANRDTLDAVLKLVFALASLTLRGRDAGSLDAISHCAACSSPLRHGAFQLAVAHPDVPEPAAGLVLPICSDCGVSVTEVRAAAWPALAPLFGPIRILPAMPDVVGHA